MPLVNQVATNTYSDSGHPGDVTKVTDPDSRDTLYSYDTYGDLASVAGQLV
jgi:YD repeat-containing protein